MASIRSYVNGAGGSTGAPLATAKPLLTSGVIYYVGNATTGASDSNTGTERTLPWLTSSHAQATVSNNDIVVYLAGHAETIASQVAWTQTGISLVGEGAGSTKPRFTCGAAITMFPFSGAGAFLDNLTFPASTVAAAVRVQTTVAGGRFSRLTFECGANDTNPSLSLSGTGATNVTITDTTFTATAASAGFALNNSGAIADLTLDNVSFDAGSFQWLGTNATAWNVPAAVTRLRATNISLLNGSNITLVTGTTGYIEPPATTGDSQINWTP
jgi:hypothetical protein